LNPSLEHVAITCPDDLVDDVIGFYEDVFGLQRLTKPEGARPKGAWLKLGVGELHISIDEHNPPKAAHFAIQVSDLDEAVTRLRNANCHIEQAAPVVGRKRFYTRDPAGNRIEVLTKDPG
jgi:catechol 2,3-dioxygenase-like lactoylglutathione lyase family enzyme